MPKSKRKVLPAADLLKVQENVKEQMLEEVAKIPGWDAFTRLERTALLCRLQTASHSDAFRMARDIMNLEPIKESYARTWAHSNRTQGFAEALTEISAKPDEWRDKLLANASTDLLVDALANHQYLIANAASDSVRMQAVDKAYQLHGLYERSKQAAIAAVAPPPIQININLWDSYKDKDGNVQQIDRTTVDSDVIVIEETTDA